VIYVFSYVANKAKPKPVIYSLKSILDSHTIYAYVFQICHTGESPYITVQCDMLNSEITDKFFLL